MKGPTFFYGTAWKENQTAELTYQALSAGFRAIDTANQRKHYFEEGVGQGLKRFLTETGLPRSEIFLQTKYTYPRGQDHRKPYDEAASFKDQVRQSLQSSLEHLETPQIDSFVLHGPFLSTGIHDHDLEVWSAMEDLQKKGQVRFLGVSNISRAQLLELHQKVGIKPHFVQNRCYASTGWDKEVRDICNKNKMIYQGFSLLTANLDDLTRPVVKNIVRKHEKSLPQIVFRFAQQMKMIPLTGTTNREHMEMDLSITEFDLSEEDLIAIETVGL